MELDACLLGGNTGAGYGTWEDRCRDLINAVGCILNFNVDTVICEALVNVHSVRVIILLTSFVYNGQC